MLLFRLIVLFSLALSIQTLLPQEVTITRIADSNLFQLKDSTYIKMAGVDIPRLSNPEYVLRIVAKNSLSFSERQLLNKTFKVRIIDKSDDYKLVYLIHEYLMGETIFNFAYLEKGFGKFLNNIDANDKEQFLSAQKKAQKNKSGIWKTLGSDTNLILDREFTSVSSNKLLADSLEFEIKKNPKPTAGHVIAELLGGMAGGLLASMASYGSTLMFYPQEREDKYKSFRNIAAYSGFSIGSASLIYLLGKNTSKDISYGYTLLSSVIGSGIGLGFLYQGEDGIDNIYVFISVLCSIAGPLIYVNAIAPDKFSQKVSSIQIKPKDNLTAANFYNRTKFIDFEILRLNF